jgi:hypothetical protein
MTTDEILEGLDDVPWAAVQGQAIPGLLRGVIAGEPDALGELQQDVVAGGVIWEASSYVMPFLARLAVAGVETLEMLDLLGGIAESHDEAGVTEPGRARREFTAQVSVIGALRDHRDPRIRAALAWTLAQDPDGTAGSLAVLREWWEGGEADPSVRCALLRAMLELDPAVAALLAVAVNGDPSPGELLIAAWACAVGGVPWTPDLQSAATAWVTAETGLPWGWWRSDADRHEPFAGLLSALAARGHAGIAAEVAADALAQVTPARQGSALQDIVWAVKDLAQAYRVPLEVLAVAVARAAAGAAADPKARKSALSLLRQFGPVPEAAGPAHTVADAGGEDPAADQALAYLVEVSDPRAPLLLAAYLPNRPQALLAAAAKPEGTFAIALALWRQAGDAADLLPVLSASLRVRGRREHYRIVDAADMAGDLGPVTLPLLPDLLSLPRWPQVIQAILRIDPASAGGIPRGDLAEHLVAAAVSDGHRSHQQVITLLRELGLTLLSPGMRERLRDAAERPRRVARSGRLTEGICADEQYRAAVRALLAETA